MEFSLIFLSFYSVASSNLINSAYLSFLVNFGTGIIFSAGDILPIQPIFLIGDTQNFDFSSNFPVLNEEEFSSNAYNSSLALFEIGDTATANYLSSNAQFLIGFNTQLTQQANSTFSPIYTYDQSSFISFFGGFEIGTYLSPESTQFFPFVEAGITFFPHVFFAGSNLGLLFNSGYVSLVSMVGGVEYANAYEVSSLLQILFGNSVQQDINYLLIKNSELGIIDLNNPESILAGILFNSLYTFDSSSNIKSVLWENIKSISENGKKYLYGVIVVSIREEFNG